MDPQNSWTMDGTLNLNNTSGAPAVLRNNTPLTSSQTIHIGNDSGTSDANIVVGGTGESQIIYRSIVFHNDADVDIAAGAILNLGSLTSYNGTDATFDGAGTLKPGQMTVNTATTFNVAVVDLEDNVSPDGASGHTIRAPLTINADAIDDEGDGFDGKMTITNDLGANLGELEVNIPPGQLGSWSFDSGEIRLVGPNPLTAPNAAEMLDGSAIEVGTEGGTLVIEGWARSTARLDIYGTVSIADETGDVFVMNGGTPATANRLLGGLIEGNGQLVLSSSRSLAGFGTIQTDLAGDGTSELVADDGTLNVSGDFVSGGIGGLRIADDGVLNISHGWFSGAISDDVVLEGGELSGGDIIHVQSTIIRGNGLITSRIQNEGGIRAEGGGTLILDPTSGDNLLDGNTNNGQLRAVSADLILRGVTGNPQDFEGAVNISPGQEMFVDGFSLNLEAPSTVTISAGTYRVNMATNIGGTNNVTGASPSRIVNEGTQSVNFLNDSNTDLDADLELDSPRIGIATSATFTGLGSLVNLEASELRLQDGANLGVTVVNRGVVNAGTLAAPSPAAATVGALTQSSTGELQFDLGGVAPGLFDALTVTNNAVLDGTIAVNLLPGFTPVLGNSFTILETTFGNVGGTFAVEAFPVFNDLTFEVIYNSQSVVLQVVEVILLAGDYNQNGIVDAADYTLWRNNLGAPAGTLANDVDGGVIGPAQYATWKSNFGATLGSGAGGVGSVPEPSSLLLCLMLAIGCSGRLTAVLVRCRA